MENQNQQFNYGGPDPGPENQRPSNQAPRQAPNSTYVSDKKSVPQEICKWNWGAFMWNMWWGIGFRTYLPLLVLIPFFNIVWIFICGAFGNKWAWENGNYESAQEFLKLQESWNRGGLIYFIVTAVLLVLEIVIIAAVGTAIVQALYNNFGGDSYIYKY